MTDLWSSASGFPWVSLLQASALILSVVNGLMLLRSYLRDRPQLVVKPVHPEVYQWFFKLPSEPFEGEATTKFGFLAYLDISNRGLRDVSVDDWNLHLETTKGKVVPLKPISIPEPTVLLGKSGASKAYPVFGHKGQFSTGETMVKSGGSISGFAYYVYEYVGGNQWSVVGHDGKVTGKIVVSDVFGNIATTKVVFTEIPLDRARSFVTEIDKVDADMSRKLEN
jgi:hypothetical protein